MNIYEIMLFMWVVILTLVVIDMIDRIKNLREWVKFKSSFYESKLFNKKKPKTGHWIYTLEDWNKWECSECGFTKRTDVHVKLGYNYCPNCGAKMENEVKK